MESNFVYVEWPLPKNVRGLSCKSIPKFFGIGQPVGDPSLPFHTAMNPYTGSFCFAIIHSFDYHSHP
jgi:hypothetical protein